MFPWKPWGWIMPPLVRWAILEVDRPSLRDNTGLADRLTRRLERDWDLDFVACRPDLAAGLGDLYSTCGYRVRVVWSESGRSGRVVTVEPADAPPPWGVAVDVGSTTLVLAVVDLDRAEVLDERRCQIRRSGTAPTF